MIIPILLLMAISSRPSTDFGGSNGQYVNRDTNTFSEPTSTITRRCCKTNVSRSFTRNGGVVVELASATDILPEDVVAVFEGLLEYG